MRPSRAVSGIPWTAFCVHSFCLPSMFVCTSCRGCTEILKESLCNTSQQCARASHIRSKGLRRIIRLALTNGKLWFASGAAGILVVMVLDAARQH